MALDTSVYDARRRSANDQHAASLATNERGRFLSQRRGIVRQGNFRRDFGRGQGAFMGNAARRGLVGGGVRSGTFQRSLNRRVGDFTRDLGEMQSDFSHEQQEFGFNASAIDRERDRMLADIEYDRQKDIAMAALNIKALQSELG